MNFYDIVKKRRSVRKFSDRPVERELILKCIESARLSPSACNSQNWKFIVVDSNPDKKELAQIACSGIYTEKAGPNSFLYQAPVIVAIVNLNNNFTSSIGAFIKGTDYSLINIGIAGEHFVLQAEELGLGTCWVGWFNEKRVKKFLNVPKKYSIPCLIALGYPAETKIADNYCRKRKSLKEIYSYGKF